ncbi:hypothetical protein TRAPUB_11653 [Trametes pubescens]|uniref:Uncharacterized protein n=1 Tax=Trametes pubescens TaxID=154538 RepID=A0A1M2VW87_TRAPU|nr:hypothetical protein TRAPUB_11653 [Trametes pubescens]
MQDRSLPFIRWLIQRISSEGQDQALKDIQVYTQQLLDNIGLLGRSHAKVYRLAHPPFSVYVIIHKGEIRIALKGGFVDSQQVRQLLL